MPDLAGARRRVRDVEEESEDSTASEESQTRESSARKRQRLSDADEDATGLTTNGVVSPLQEVRSNDLPSRKSSQQHQPGSIVRVKLSNFVTYTAAEFFPGPNLNMVVGPNGTGKSTLVCAICLGLGWGSQHLGRAKEVSEFVKLGNQEAHIEIELAKDGRRFKKNVIIGCTIKREGNKSLFTINGKQAVKKHVVDLCRSMAIQIDNLCQFLPQDKVVEFAAMTPVELLRSTQRAVGTQEMMNMHEALKEQGRKQKEVQTKINADQETHNKLESRQRLQEADVQRMREREEIVKRVERLELARPTVNYRIAREGFNEAKAKRKEAQNQLKTLQREVQPSLRAVNAKQKYTLEIDSAVKSRKEAIVKAEKSADTINRRFDDLQGEMNELDGRIEALAQDRKKRKDDALRLERIIGELRNQMQHATPEVDISAYNEKIRAKQREAEEARSAVTEIQEQQRQLTAEAKQESATLESVKRSLSALDSVAGKQAHKLSRLSRDTAVLWKYIQEHSDQFEKQVFGPPIVECSVKDVRYADMIESLFQRNLVLSCTVQTKNDFQKLSDIAHEQLSLSEVNIKTMPGTLADFKSPISEAQMRRYGFDGWVIDYMNGPESVLAMLCSEIRLHETGVASQDTSSEQYQMLMDSNVSSWVTKKSTYRVVRRREYGPDATSTQVRDVRPAQVWNDQPDLAAKQGYTDQIREISAKVREYESQVHQLQQQVQEHRAVYTQCQQDGRALSEEKGQKQRALQEVKGLPTKIAGNESKLESLRNSTESLVDQRRDYLQKQDAIAMQRAHAAVRYADAVKTLHECHTSLHEAEVIRIEAASDLSILVERNRSVRDTLQDKQKEIESCDQECNKMRQMAERVLKEVQEIFSRDQDNTLREFFASLDPKMTLADLESEIYSEKARLDLMHEGSGNVIREYEQRKKDVQNLSTRIASAQAILTELDESIATLRTTWEPQLDRLIGRISAAFSHNMEQISCAGEVSILKSDSFDDWAIEVRVKFRENEPLNLLTAHRQSGGERAVSTIFYLMSLQLLTPCPFRVVDEINQGMDPRNERLVHKRMVDIACGRDTLSNATATAAADRGEEEALVPQGGGGSGSQYFLITPKLLPDLSYAPGMQVMCIASGEYMPAEQTRVDFKVCLDRMRGLKAAPAAAAVSA